MNAGPSLVFGRLPNIPTTANEDVFKLGHAPGAAAMTPARSKVTAIPMVAKAAWMACAPVDPLQVKRLVSAGTGMSGDWEAFCRRRKASADCDLPFRSSHDIAVSKNFLMKGHAYEKVVYRDRFRILCVDIQRCNDNPASKRNDESGARADHLGITAIREGVSHHD